ncbi:MAG TPA: ATP-dependent zinc metalloprotease FtsH [Solirubrobacteraceae bacterium]|jgi:cell division protease FtsH|nr:ATP-dependent zinc metalloprotease FtsH [Solirubrobacteraceae bacterium]
MDEPTKRAPEKPDQQPWRVEGARGRRPDGNDRPGAPGAGGGGDRPRLRFPRWLLWMTLGLLVLNFVVASRVPDDGGREQVPFSTFEDQVERGNVTEVNAQGDVVQGEFARAVDSPTDEDESGERKFETTLPAFVDSERLSRLLEEKDVQVNARPIDEGRSFLAEILLFFGPTLLLVGLFIFLMRRAAGGAGGALTGLGRSKAKRYEASEQRTTFEDVAGIEEAEEELVEIVDFLKNPDRYRRLGAMIPKGVLLSGPPGTGKTLLARAVAGEADVPFFSLSASEFIEMVVGVGASRVRDLFENAKKAAPAIIFIDELDAIGRSRGGPGGNLGGHDEREQTLNQILTEMDGFTGSEGVIVLAATNRPEILDQALLRPGRFDRRVAVSPPDKDGREQILRVHTRGKPLDPEVDLSAVAATTPGMVGADLRNLVNEAALSAARRNDDTIKIADFTNSLERIVLGAERRITISADERERTAYHESGHALLGMLEPGADPVRKVSIVPRGRALGVTFQSPETDRYGYDQSYLRGRIVGALGGRAAEELIYGNVTTGAESDLEQVTRIARQMVGRWGMSDRIGLVSVLPGPMDDPTFFPGTNGAPSEATRELVDEEVRKIVDECYAAALHRLRENRDRLEMLARTLLEHETLDEEAAYRAAGFERKPPAAEQGDAPDVDRVAAAEVAPRDA